MWQFFCAPQLNTSGIADAFVRKRKFDVDVGVAIVCRELEDYAAEHHNVCSMSSVWLLLLLHVYAYQ